MTVAVEEARIVHTGNGVTTNWPYTFPVLDADDMQVYTYEIATGIVTGPLSDSLYTVNEVGEDDGSVDYPLVGSPLASTHKIILMRRVDMLQPYNFNTASGFDPAALTSQLDLMTMMIQQNADDVSRALKVDVSGTTDPDGLVDGFEEAVLAAAASAAAAAASETAAETAETNAEAAQAAAEAAAASINPALFVEIADTSVAGFGFVLDEDDMASNSATKLATQQSTKAYVDYRVNYLNVKLFGATGDGSTNDTTAINNAIAAANLTGRGVFFPAGIYNVTTLTTLPEGTHLLGESMEDSVIRTTSASGNVVTVDAHHVVIESLKFSSTVTRSGTAGSTGNYLYLDNDAWHFVMRDCWMEAPFVGVYAGNAYDVHFDNVKIYNAVATTGISFYVDYTFALHINNCTFDTLPPSNKCNSHVYINRCGDCNISACQFIRAEHDMFVSPGTGVEADSIRVIHTYFDTFGTSGVTFAPTGTGLIQRCDFVQCWFSGGPGHGFLAQASGSAIVRGLTFTSCHFLGDTNGIYLNGSGVSNVELVGCQIAGCTNGFVADGAQNVRVTGGVIGSWGGFGPNTLGLSLTGTANYYSFIGVALADNTSIATITMSGLDLTFTSCRGYTGWRAWTPTVTAAAGTITSASATGTYLREGRTVRFQLSIVVTTNGTGATALRASLPFAVVAGKNFIANGRENTSSGHQCQGFIAAGTSLVSITKYDNTYPAADGRTIYVSGEYEVAA